MVTGKKATVGTRTRKAATPVAPVSSSKPADAAPAPAPAKEVAKPAAAAAPAPVKPKSDKEKKPKLVRDSFTIPKAEYAVIDELKERAVRLGVSMKKGELLRAGIKALAAMPDAKFLAAIKLVPNIKTGRPAK